MKIQSLLWVGSLMSMLSFQSCTKNFLDYNTDKSGATPKEVERDGYVLSAALTGLQAWVIPLDVNANQFIECLLGGNFGGYLSDSNNGFNGKNFATYTPDNAWARVPFNDIIPSIFIRNAKVRAVTSDPVPIAVADIIKVMAMARVTDIYGPIPYSKIGKDGALTASYDSEEEVYTLMIQQLDAAIKTLTDNRNLNFTAKADLVYAGNVVKWIKLANSMKLRLAIHIAHVSPTLAKRTAESAVADEIGPIVDNADNAAATPINKNPFRVIMYEYNNGDSRVSADITSYMNSYNDPRRDKYFTISAFSGSVTNGYFGLRSGIQIPSGDNVKLYTNMRVSETDRVQWMNAAETAFLRAEGALYGWNMGGPAMQFYETGVRLSFAQWGASGADTYLANSSSSPSSYIDPLGMFSYSGTVGTATIKWDEALGREQKIEKIITQKWIANFPLGIEAWTEYRRTGYPKLMRVMVNNSAGKVNSDRMARRLAYPQEEYTENNQNVNQAVSKYLNGKDNMGTDLWWAKKN